MKRTAWLALALILPGAVYAQGNPFDLGNGPGKGVSTPWTGFKLPKKSIKLDFKNAGVDAIIQFFQQQSGVTIVKDPGLTGQLSVTTAKAVSLGDAFQVLATTLSLKGFDMEKQGNLLVIKKKDAKQQKPAFDISQLANFPGTGDQPQSVLKVYPIKFANAAEVARVVNDVFTPSAQGNNRNPFAALFQRGGNRFNRGGGGATIQFGGPPQDTGPNVRASSDDYSNTVIVNAPDKDQKEVENLIKQIDVQTDDPQVTQVYTLQYANATDVAPTVQNVLVSNAPRGKGGQGQQSIDPFQRFQQAARFGSSQAAFGQVVADTRTNSIVVTATPSNQTVVAEVVKQLDTPIEVQNTTFVFPLSNARADDVANLLNQTFGQRQGVNGSRGSSSYGGNYNNNNRNNNNNNRNNNNRNNNNRGNTGFGGDNSANPKNDPNELALDVNPDGELQTNVAVAQGFGFFGGQNRNNQQNQQPSRDANGRIINTRDLTGQITAIPDLNTNSIIVVATPEDADIIRQILDQLDKIPEQVMIETIIVEATLDSSNKLGVEWNLVQNNVFNTKGNTGTAGTNFGVQTPAATDPTAGLGFKYTLTGGSLTGIIQALQSDSKFQVLSTPRIFTSNNVQAQINISQQIPYVTSSRQDPTTGAFTYNYSFEDVGIILTVQPRITANGYVAMDVTQTANELQGFTSFNAPIINQREADTTVSVKDGETIILGGIIRNTVNATVNKIPLLGDLPLLGTLFRSTSKENVKTELLVFLTPHVVRDPDEAKKLREDGEKQMSPDTQKSLDSILRPKQGDKGGQVPPPVVPPAKTGGGH